MLDRMEENMGGSARSTVLRSIVGYRAELRPEEYIKRGQVYVGFEVNEELLPAILDEYGDECWLYASDIPHNHRMYRAADFLMHRTDVREASKRNLLVGNTARFYDYPLAGGG
jgi:predicted TIM-barrel fold metal-dependent hydrolase